MWQEFESDGLGECEIGGPIDFAHPALSKQPDDPVAPAKQRAGHKAAFIGNVSVMTRNGSRERGREGGCGFLLRVHESPILSTLRAGDRNICGKEGVYGLCAIVA